MRRSGFHDGQDSLLVAERRTRQAAVDRAGPARNRHARSPARLADHCDVVLETSPRPARQVGLFLRGAGRPQPEDRAGARRRLRADGAARHPGRLRQRRRSDGRHPLHDGQSRSPTISGRDLAGWHTLASVFAVIGTLAALVRPADRQGPEVDVAIYEAVATLMESTMADFEFGGITRTRSGSVLLASRRRTSTRPATAPRSSSRPTRTTCSSACARRSVNRSGHRPRASRPIGAGARTWRSWTARRSVDHHRAVPEEILGEPGQSVVHPPATSSQRPTCSPTPRTSPATWCAGSRPTRVGRYR